PRARLDSPTRRFARAHLRAPYEPAGTGAARAVLLDTGGPAPDRGAAPHRQGVDGGRRALGKDYRTAGCGQHHQSPEPVTGGHSLGCADSEIVVVETGCGV